MTTKNNGTAEGKTLGELQGILAAQMDRIIAGETTPANANAVVNLTAAYLRTVKMQMDYYKQIGRTPNIPLLLTAEIEPAA
jgi:hypothetical protein